MTTTRRAPPTSMSRTPTPAVDRPLPAAEARDASNRLATTWDPYISDHPVYYISRRARGHDDADDSSRRLATTWDPCVSDHLVYYISRRTCVHDDADDSPRRLATTWDPHIYQTTLYIIFVDDQHESGSFSPGDLGLPSAPGFSAIHQPTGDQPVGAGRGICEGRCWGSTPRFSSFLCARLRTTFRRAQPRIASVLRHRRGSTTIHQRPGQ